MNTPFLLDDFELSNWAYWYCTKIEDDPEIRKYITKSLHAYLYCEEVNDDPDVRKNIIHLFWINCYKNEVKNGHYKK